MSGNKKNQVDVGKKIYISALAVFTQIVSSLIFYYEYDQLQVGARLFLHFYILIGVSFILSIFIFLSRDAVQKDILVILRYTVVFLIGYPLGDDVFLEIILFAGIIFEAVFFLKLKHGLVILLISNTVFLLTQRQASAWDQSLESVSLHNLLSAGVINMINTGSAFALKAAFCRISKQQCDIGYMNSAISKLSDINIGFQNFVKEQEFKILIEERKRISREIHDTVGYTLTNIIMMMEVLKVTGDRDHEKRDFIITNTKEQALKGLEETRAALRQLRRKEIPQKHGSNMIYELVSAFRLASGIDISINFGNLPEFIDYEIDRIVFRFIQEGMTNVFRHGMATRIGISFWVSDKKLRATIKDNGIGAAEIVEGIGMAGMKERLQKVNGRLILANIQNGFKAEIIIPLDYEMEIRNAKNQSAAG